MLCVMMMGLELLSVKRTHHNLFVESLHTHTMISPFYSILNTWLWNMTQQPASVNSQTAKRLLTIVGSVWEMCAWEKALRLQICLDLVVVRGILDLVMQKLFELLHWVG